MLTVDAAQNSRVFLIDDGNGIADKDVTIQGLTITNGRGIEDFPDSGDFVEFGGGITSTENFTLVSSVVSGSTSYVGGGIATLGNLNLINSTVAYNTAVAGGGIFDTGAGSTTILNSTLSNNTAQFYGGGFISSGPTTLEIINSTITGNTALATYTGGLLDLGGSDVTISNSIIAGNTAPSYAEIALTGSLTTSGVNLFGDNSKDNSGAFFQVTPGANDIIATSDGNAPTALADILGPLADNGGPTSTHALPAGSPAINVGNNAFLPADTFDLDNDSDTSEAIPFDQRGEARVVGGTVDIGAFESTFLPIPTVTLTVDPTTGSEANGTTITVTVTASAPVDGDQTVSVALSGTATAADFTGTIPETLTILDGETTASFTVDINDDAIAEGLETATFTLSNPSAGLTLGATTEANVDISDNDIRTTVRVEAEDITNVTGYRLEGNRFASGNQMLSLVGFGGDEVGTASFSFSGTSDTYDIVLGAFDESDGNASLEVTLNGQQIGLVELNENPAGGGANGASQVTRLVATGVAVALGDTLVVTGNEDGREHARFDFIEFRPSSPVSNTPPIAVDDAVSTDEGTVVTGNVLTNDEDADLDTLTVIEVEGNVVDGTSITLASGALLTLNANGSFVYDPDGMFDDLIAGETATDSFTYVLTDGRGGFSEATVTVTVEGVDTSTLSITVTPASISENGGTATAVVTRNNDTSGDLVVTLGSDDTTELTVPPTVTILAGESSAIATLTAVDDLLADGTQTATVTASAPGFIDGTATVAVTDDETPLLSLEITPTTLSEGDSAIATVTRNTGTTGDLTVTLSSSDLSEATVPATVTIPDGADAATFTVTAVEDLLIDGTQPATITVTAAGFDSATETLSILDGGEVPEFAPIITSPAAVSAPETQTLALDIEATDANGDSEGNGLTYTLTGGADQNAFGLDPDTGVLNFATAPDFENPGDSNGDNVYEVEVTVTDSTNRSDVQLFNVTVTDVDEIPVGDPIRLEAEDVDLFTGFRLEVIAAASGRRALSFVRGDDNETGSATFNFDGAAGSFDIIVGAFDENDGLARFELEVNDKETGTSTPIGILNLDTQPAGSGANRASFISPTVAFGVNLTPGDSITVKGFEDGREHARLDYLELVPVI